MDYLTNNPDKTFLVRLSSAELDAVKAYGKKAGISANQIFRIMANQIEKPF